MIACPVAVRLPVMLSALPAATVMFVVAPSVRGAAIVWLPERTLIAGLAGLPAIVSTLVPLGAIVYPPALSNTSSSSDTLASRVMVRAAEPAVVSRNARASGALGTPSGFVHFASSDQLPLPALFQCDSG